MEQTHQLAEAFPQEQARLRRIQTTCKEIGPVCNFLYMIIEDVLVRADKAVMEQDTVAMIRIYEEMENIHE